MRHRKTGNFGNISQISQNSSSLALVGCSLHLRFLRFLRFRQGTPRPLRFFAIFFALRSAFTIFVV